jgi:hypothetical protein
MTGIQYLSKFLKDRDDISVYEYLLLASLIVVGATVGIVEYLL